VRDLDLLYDTINSFESAILTLFIGQETIVRKVYIKGIDQQGLLHIELPHYETYNFENFPIPVHLELFRKQDIELNISAMASKTGISNWSENNTGGNLKVRMFYAEFQKRPDPGILEYLRGKRFHRKILVLK
jgi:hypothetical protein